MVGFQINKIRNMKTIGYFFYLLISASVLSASSIAQSAVKKNMAYADSVFLARDFKESGVIYKSLISDTSHDAFHLNRLGYTELMLKNYHDAALYLNRALVSHPSTPLKASILSRLARVSAVQNKTSDAITLLDSAVADGYLSYPELDTLEDYSKIRNSAGF